MPEPECEFKDEYELTTAILGSLEHLTCYNCGERLIDNVPLKSDVALGTLRFDKGAINYPISPDDPANIYFECEKCRLNSPQHAKQYANREDLVKQVRRYLTKATGLKTIVNLIRTHGLKGKEEKECACGIYEDQGVTCWEHTDPEIRDKCFPNGKPKEE